MASPRPLLGSALVFCAALGLAAALAGCLDPGSPGAPEASATAAPRTQSQPSQPHRPGVPDGCTLEWSGVARDSVLNCPDIRPPSPK